MGIIILFLVLFIGAIIFVGYSQISLIIQKGRLADQQHEQQMQFLQHRMMMEQQMEFDRMTLEQQMEFDRMMIDQANRMAMSNAANCAHDAMNAADHHHDHGGHHQHF